MKNSKSQHLASVLILCDGSVYAQQNSVQLVVKKKFFAERLPFETCKRRRNIDMTPINKLSILGI